ncbi:hypothetical protein [Cerasicoccus maritimus]|uniref:hypothetical protein n=1 Tax=Cerasicoccus maritimus TaxID=490089 RepID=UPI002852D0E4|nr:hypothetical protein [Cerasicoccus maritimus]
MEIAFLDSMKSDSREKILVDRLQLISDLRFVEIWLKYPRFPMLGVLINSDDAFLQAFRFQGDPGFFSNNPSRSECDELVEFELENGQVDEFPSKSCYTKKEAIRACLDFAVDGKFPDWIDWIYAGMDGADSPNDKLSPE